MAKKDPSNGHFTLCPMLQNVLMKGDVTLDDCAALSTFIESRWRTPFRTIKSIDLRVRDVERVGDLGESVERCVEEGLGLVLKRA